MDRRLAAILAADVVGYSAMMARDESGTLARLIDFRRTVFDPQITRYNGRVVKLMGDGALVEFASVVDAVECAIAIQMAVSEASGDDLRLRMGINLGDVISDGSDIYGDGVNVAARLQEVCRPGGVAMSAGAHEQVKGKVGAAFQFAGDYVDASAGRFPAILFEIVIDGD